MDRRITDRNASFKKVRITYSTQIPDEYLSKYCMVYRLNRSDAVSQFIDAAINAAEQEIDNQLSEVSNVKI